MSPRIKLALLMVTQGLRPVPVPNAVEKPADEYNSAYANSEPTGKGLPL